MPGRKKISDYFQPQRLVTKKRAGTDCCTTEQLTKKSRLELPSDNNHSLDGGCQKRSPSKAQRMVTNHLTARIRLLSKKTAALHPNIGVSWFEALEPEFSKPYFLKLSEFLVEERKRHVIYPPPDKVYTWTRVCAIQEVKVVLLGQDPYHGPNQAHGLSFSVQKGVPPPPSLVNMFTELETDFPGFVHPEHGNLSGWAQQGVLLLNACLSVREHSPNSHQNHGWETFTDAVISWLNKNCKNLVFLLWGAYAQKKCAMIDKKCHLILKCTHPSPLSAHRGFFNCKHFSKTNQYLIEKGKSEIDWNHLPVDIDVN